MLDVIKQQISTLNSHTHKINRTRELLQIIILYHLSNEGFFEHHCFIGGTALRICHGLQRYSEDLDFSVKNTSKHDYDILIQAIQTLLEQYGFAIEITQKPGIIYGFTIKFTKILYDLGLSGYDTQKVQIKCEIDTQAPAGGERETVIINDIFLFPLHVHTLPSLFAGKLHAILQRGFIKGRDWFDLIWYLSKKIDPNFRALHNALQQTGYGKPVDSRSDIVEDLIGITQKLTTKQLLDDVGIFLQDDTQKALLDVDLIQKMILNH